MTDFVLNLDQILTNTNTLAGTITGIRSAFNYSNWPTRPPGEPNKGQAYHFTGMPGTDGTGISYIQNGMDLSEYILGIPLYTVVSASANLDRAAGWIAGYVGLYPEKFRDNGKLSGAIANGIALFEQPAQIVRQIPEYPSFNGFYILRWILTVHTKGPHTNSP
jgi:hypothetical protein